LPKSIKLANDTYLDSSSIVHNKQKLSDILNKDVYSFDETIIGTWVNGKPLYRKVINCGSSSKNESIPHNIKNMDFVMVNGYMNIAGVGGYPLPWFNSFAEGNYIKISVSSEYIIKNANNSWNMNVIAILEYTKTTD